MGCSWPLTVYKIPLSKVEKMEMVISAQVKQWTSTVLKCFEITGIAITSLVEEFKCTKPRLVMSLTDSEDIAVRTAVPREAVGRKWTPSEAVYNAKLALYFRDAVGQVQHGRAGLALIPKALQWHKATSRPKRELVLEEIRRQEDESQWPSRVNGLTGWILKRKNPAGVTFGEWRDLG